MTQTFYLASPYGFASQQQETLLPPIVLALESLGLEVWEPFARNNPENFAEAGWAYRIGDNDISDVVNSAATFAGVNGVPPDEGVTVELSMVIALGKPTFLFRDDFRRATDSREGLGQLCAVRMTVAQDDPAVNRRGDKTWAWKH